MTTTTVTTVPVTGLTCSGCVETVTEQLSAVAGVSGVSVELVKGGVSTVTVEAEHPLEDAQVQEALRAGGAFRIVR